MVLLYNTLTSISTDFLKKFFKKTSPEDRALRGCGGCLSVPPFRCDFHFFTAHSVLGLEYLVGEVRRLSFVFRCDDHRDRFQEVRPDCVLSVLDCYLVVFHLADFLFLFVKCGRFGPTARRRGCLSKNQVSAIIFSEIVCHFFLLFSVLRPHAVSLQRS